MSFDHSPSWAQLHNYYHHSVNNTPDFYTFLQKCFIRPQVSNAWNCLKNNGLSTITNKSDAEKIISKYFNDSPPMAFGRAVQQVCDGQLLEKQTETEAFRHVIAKLDEYKTPDWRKGTGDVDAIAARLKPRFSNVGKKPTKKTDSKDTYSEFELVCKNAMTGLQEAMQGVNKIEGEIDCWKKIGSCDLKYNGRPDYISRIELKTRWDRSPIDKPTANSIPKELPFAHLKQVAGYWHLTGQLPSVVIANRLDFKIYQPSEDELRYALNDIEQACTRREKLLKAAPDTKTLLSMVDPQWDHQFIWKDSNPEVMHEIRNDILL